jgi:hypothetical protein
MYLLDESELISGIILKYVWALFEKLNKSILK